MSKHQTSRQEVRDLLAVADRDIQASQLPGLPPDWRLNIAYNAALQAANAALAASGYRAEKAAQHYRILQSLEYTVGASQGTIDQLDAFRKKRNISSYDRPGTISESDATEMIRLAEGIHQSVRNWLRANKPDLFEE